MARKLKLKAKAASKAIRKLQHTRKNTSRKSHSRRTIHCVSRGTQSKKSTRPNFRYNKEQHKVIRGYSDVNAAARAAKLKSSRSFLLGSISMKGEAGRGWNLKKKHYSFGGVAVVNAKVSGFSEFPVDESALEFNRFRHIKFSELQSEDYWFSEFFEKKVNRIMGSMTLEEAKKVYEKYNYEEEERFNNMNIQFRSDNQESGEIDKIKWFKLIVR